MDIPNERSSHITPTPRGGGIAFVATSLVGFLLLLLNNALNESELFALCCAGVIVAIAGHLDDRQKISGATVRLVLHVSQQVKRFLFVPQEHFLAITFFQMPTTVL